MKISVKDIRSGKLNGKIVWICHYHRPDMDKKPLRNIPPTKVYICSNDELPKNKTVYYTQSHFRPLLNNGEPGSKILSPVDNTGFRSRSGEELYAFDNEIECKKHWNNQLANYFVRLDEKIENSSSFWKAEKAELIKKIAEIK